MPKTVAAIRIAEEVVDRTIADQMRESRARIKRARSKMTKTIEEEAVVSAELIVAQGWRQSWAEFRRRLGKETEEE